ncbi:MAG: flagellar hook-associated protein FlgK [Bacillota bacterium]|jgi:flagellar hook-associated protein 1 FlgK|nr:flagellar hook-associated protein FlgK [Candidatus Fermentithermobacillaceae bacterium]
MSTFSMFEIGKSALIASKRTMDVTSHNIANAATPGYSRQDAFLEPLIQRQSQMISGVGVRVADIRRTRDIFVDAVLRNESGREAAFLVQQEVLDHVQTAVAEPQGNSIRETIDSFWSAWQDLSSDADSPGARAQLMERGRSLVDMFNHLGGQLDSVTEDIDIHIESLVVRVNDLAERVAGLNVEIARALARQEPAADLMDRRDLLLDELTELTGGTVSFSGEGNNVRFSIGGFPIVDRDKTYKIEVSTSPTGTEFKWLSSPEGAPQTMSSIGGRLGGLKTAKEQLVVDFKHQLERLFGDIVRSVNSVHIQGDAGIPFFVQDSGALAYLGFTQVNPAIVADQSLIAATRNPDEPGDMALEIADILADGCDDPDNPGETILPFIETWIAMMGTLGAKAQKVETGVTTQGLLVKELRNRRDSISGVSVDEEVAQLIRQQHAFSAASRVITVADEVIDTIINRMGHAGR